MQIFCSDFWDLRELCQIESFLCINTLIKPEDQERYLQEQKDKFTPFISELQMDADIKLVKYENAKGKGIIVYFRNLWPSKINMRVQFLNLQKFL